MYVALYADEAVPYREIVKVLNIAIYYLTIYNVQFTHRTFISLQAGV